MAAIVIVPGLGLRADVEGRVARSLGAAVVHLPGYGERAPRDEDLTAVGLARRVADALVRPAVLVGHSASCTIVAEAAGLAPHLVAGLVLVGPIGDPRATSRAALARRWLRTAGHEHPHQIPLLVHDYARTGLLSIRRALDAIRVTDPRPVLRAARPATLVVRGRNDRICPADWAGEVAAAAGGTAETTDGAHMIVLTHPDQLVTAIRLWVSARVRPDARQDDPPGSS